MIPNRQNKSKGDAKRGPNKDDNKPKTISDFRLQFVWLHLEDSYVDKTERFSPF